MKHEVRDDDVELFGRCEDREVKASVNIAFTTVRAFLEATDVEWW
jgi:hypothetical protein